MKKNWTWPSVACICLTGAAWMAGQDSRAQVRGAAAAGRVGVIDVERLFSELKQVKDVDALMKQRGEALRNEATRMMDAITQAQTLLDQMQPNTPAGRRQAQKFLQTQVEYAGFREMLDKDTKREKLNWTADTYKKVIEAVEAVAMRRGMEIVLSYYPPPTAKERTWNSFQRDIFLRTVLYRSKQADLTDEVIREADKRYVAAGGRGTIKLWIGPATP